MRNGSKGKIKFPKREERRKERMTNWVENSITISTVIGTRLEILLLRIDVFFNCLNLMRNNAGIARVAIRNLKS